MPIALACCDPWLLLISCWGFLILLNHSISLGKWFFNTFFSAQRDLIKNYGSWALVTGATDGIGEAFAYRLAQRGLNLVLVSRSYSKLEAVCNEIKAKFPNVQIKIIQIDFCGDVSMGIQVVREAARDLDLGILINNAGITYPRAMFFHEVEEKVWMDIVRVNVEGTTAVTKAVLEGMISRNRGAIVNIGSGAGIVVPSHPLYSIYAATKAYVNQLSRSLHVECKKHGIHVQCQVPLYVATEMVLRVASIERPSFFVASPEEYAEAAVRRIGYEAQCTPYWPHSLQWFLASLVPHSLLDAWRFSVVLRRLQ